MTLIEFFIRIALIALTFLYYGVTPSWGGVVIGLLFLLPLYLFMTGLGFILSLAAGVLRDIPNIISLILIAIMLMTPVLYPIRGESFLAKVNVWNPWNYLVNVPRDMILDGRSGNIPEFALSAMLSVGVFYLGWRLFFLAQTKIAERI